MWDLPRSSPDIEILIWNSVAQDFGCLPRVRDFLSHFVDFEKGLVMHVYDDRGMDVIATTPDPLVELYTKFNGWLLDYDRARMDATFNAYLSTLQ